MAFARTLGDDAPMTLAVSRTAGSAGALLREWRQRRRMSQLDFALEAEISQKHLSFVETGRAQPSREMVSHLAERLGVPLRERNAIMLAAGYAPIYPERDLDDPALAPARAAVRMILDGHAPYPALAVDRRWNLVEANATVGRLIALVADGDLLKPPVNVLRLSLAPGGLAPHIANLAEWRAHVLARLRREAALSGDRAIAELRAELAALPCDAPAPDHDPAGALGGIAIPFRLRTPAGELALISTITVFGTPLDVTLSELALEMFFPAEPATAAALRALAESR